MTPQAITFRLPGDLYEQLRRDAFEQRSSMNEIVIEALTQHFAAGKLKSPIEKAVWAAWNALTEDDPSPVKRIAKQLNMTPADVAFIVYPAETFGRWADDHEPNI